MAVRRKQRGSVLLMAIGMLTIIALLASTFLIVANLDAQEAETLATKAQADPLAEGALATALTYIGADLYIDANRGPFSKATFKSEDWRQYMEFPQDDVDDWLATPIDDPNQLMVGHLSRTVSSDTITNSGGNSGLFNNASRADANLVDTNGDDPNRDAFLYDTKVKSTLYDLAENEVVQPKKMNYWIAVRIVDQGGKVCVNTAGGRTAPGAGSMPRTITPMYVDLNAMIGTAAYGNVSDARFGPVSGVDKTLRSYDANCARKLLDSNSGYVPYACGDDMFLLWCQPLRKAPPTCVGGLAEAIYKNTNLSTTGRVSDLRKRSLATFTCTNGWVRHPQPSSNVLTNFTRLERLRTEDGPLASPDAYRQTTFRRMFRMFQELNVPSSADISDDSQRVFWQKRMAAHFVANAWAYELSDADTNPCAFRPVDPVSNAPEGWVAYGLKPDLVISEAFAKHQHDSDAEDPNEDWAWGYAIEVINPTSRNINLANYRIQVGAGMLAPLTSGVVSAASGGSPGRYVLYDFGAGAKGAPSEDVFFGGSWGGGATSRQKVAGLDFSGGGEGTVTVTLLRTAGVTEYVPIDQVTSDPNELNYSLAGKEALKSPGPGGAEKQVTLCDIARDDRLQEAGGSVLARYNLGLYKQYKFEGKVDDAGGSAQHTLNALNSLQDGDIKDNTASGGASNFVYSCPIYRASPSGAEMASIGHAADIYLAGPWVESGDKMGVFPRDVLGRKGPSVFRNVPRRGRLPVHPENVTDGYGTGKVFDSYPDVPLGTMLSEFLTHVAPHDTRKADKTRVYGQINANTATKLALRYLPWPTSVSCAGQTFTLGSDYDANTAADYIIAYREMGISGSVSYAGSRSGTGISGLRAKDTTPKDAGGRKARGYVTPGEVAVPLSHYMARVLQTKVDATALQKSADYPRARNALYAAVADCLATRSDVFAAYIRVQLGKPGKYTWYYLAVIDRTNVRQVSDMPAVLMFSEVR